MHSFEVIHQLMDQIQVYYYYYYSRCSSVVHECAVSIHSLKMLLVNTNMSFGNTSLASV